MRPLGPLERAVMEVLWRTEHPVTVRVVLEALTAERKLAYTTVMTVLDHLRKKGYVERIAEGRAYLYRPTSSRVEAAAAWLRAVLNDAADPEAVLLNFASSMSERELAALRAALNRGTPAP